MKIFVLLTYTVVSLVGQLALAAGPSTSTKFEPVPAYRFKAKLDAVAGKDLFERFIDQGVMLLHTGSDQPSIAIDSLHAEEWYLGRNGTCAAGVGHIVTITTPPNRRKISIDEGNLCSGGKASALYKALEAIAGHKTEDSYKRSTDFCMTDLSIMENLGAEKNYDVSGIVLDCSLFWPPNY